jgi:hypothetical protein
MVLPRQSARNRSSRAILMLLVVAALQLAAASAAYAATEVSIHAEKQGGAVAIEARAVLVAPLPLIWQTLTDYNQLSTFVPGMYASRVIERRGSVVIVKQSGEAGFLIFKRPIDVVVESLEKPPHVVQIRVLSGNLKKLNGRYQIEPDAILPGTFVLRWSGLIEPEVALPPLIGVPIFRSNIADQFRGMVREIERRTELQRKGAK